jgi:hypothetical protein
MREERSNMLIWDDQSKRGDDMWWRQQDIGRSKIRQLLRTEDNGFDLTGYDLGTVRTLRDYEKYAGIHFKKKAFQKYTKDRGIPPNPVIENEQEWEDSFMKSFYYLVNVTREMLPADDYESILIAFDDENGNGIETRYIQGPQLDNFIKLGKPIHYEEMFMTEKDPVRVVYWGVSKERGWAERYEIQL